MKPMSKFAVFLAVAGVLTVLFALFPARGPKTGAPKETPKERAGGSAEEPKSQVSTGGTVQLAQLAQRKASFSSSRFLGVKVPAIRGANNYGWVQLPRGTPVEFVGHDRNRLLVRWDGTLMQLPESAVATGAVILRSPPRPTGRS